MNIERYSLSETTAKPIGSEAAGVVVSQRALHERRRLAAFYTPERLSNLLSNWAIRNATDRVLEPSFGGCGFLTSAITALKRVGCANPSGQIYGCDIDPTAFQYLRSAFGPNADIRGFLFCDFLDCGRETEWPPMFDAVLANPPYIPHHRIGKARVRELSRRDWPIPNMSGRCSLWAYFIAHALTMLKVGGRMAWVLPGAFLQANYAKPIKSFLASRFDRVATFLVRDRLFISEGTDEETVVLLADCYRAEPGTGAIELGAAATLDELQSLITAWDNSTWSGDTSGSSPASLGMSPEAIEVFARLKNTAEAVSFGTFARVQIGIVTGANDFFVLNGKGLHDAQLEPSDCERVLSKFRAAPGLILLGADLHRYEEAEGKTYLVNTNEPDANNRVGRYLKTFGDERRRTNSTFKKRSLWSATSDGKEPDGFFPVMHHNGPRLVLNEFGCTSTNTIHRVFFKTAEVATRRLVAISLLTSFSQVSAELIGRRYGSGVLKHEPRDAEKISLLIPKLSDKKVNDMLLKIDKLLREGQTDKASAAADAFIFQAIGIENYKTASQELQSSLTVIREHRRPRKTLAKPAVAPHLS